jgi:phosphonate transport system substrate-binding protein
LKSLLRLTVFYFAFLMSFFAAQFVHAAPKPITIGFIPGENPDVLKEHGQGIAKLIETKIGVPVNIFVSKDYNDMIVAMKEKKVDFAFFTAMTYVFAEREAGAKVLLKKVWEGPYYFATILAKNASKLQQLKGKSFAFVDQKSTSGYLYPQVYFKKNNVDPQTFFKETVFSGNHTESIRLLREGKVDAVAVFSNDEKAKDSAWERFPSTEGKKQSKPKVLWVSAAIPNDPFVVRQDFYDKNPKLAHDLMFGMMELVEDPKEGQNFQKLLSVKSLMLATSAQYEPVREMVKELDLKPEAR